MGIHPDPSYLTELNHTLDRQIAGLEAVRTALESERLALESRDTQALEQATSAKIAGLEIVETMDRRRRELSESVDEATLSASGSTPELLQRVSRVEQLARDCDQANKLNGALINVQQKLVSRTLQVLRRGDAAGPSTYSSDGSDPTPSSRIPIGTA